MIVNITYYLDWKDGSGYQPYEQVASCGAKLDGGLAVINGNYLGKIEGTEEQIFNAIESCKKYGMKKLNDKDKENFLSGKKSLFTLEDRVSALEKIVSKLSAK
jgi:hypothetical protein